MDSLTLLQGLCAAHLPDRTRDWLKATTAQIAAGLAVDRFCARFAMASRFVPRGPLSPDPEERARVNATLEGLDPERWSALEMVRMTLLLSVPDLATESGAELVEECFCYADEGELCALYRALALLPDPERFRWRAGEGCRSNMRSVFEATACDTPYAFLHFDAAGFRQAVLKSLFVGAPLWRIFGLDRRLSKELSRMALDYADERRSAGRPIPPELWLCLGESGGERGLEALARESRSSAPTARAAVVYALARAGHADRIPEIVADDTESLVVAARRDVAEGLLGQERFRSLHQETD
jgi:hypothetical protein